MKIIDITEAIVNSLENKIFEEWKHEGYIDGFTSDKAYVVIDGTRYKITVEESEGD